ncbi:MAG: TonB-dependent receptor [Bacteroidales bacterium]
MEKKILTGCARHISGRFKMLKIMKIALLLLILGITNVHASVFSQTVNIDLSLSNVSLREAFTRIEEKTEYKFLYRSDLIDINKVTNIEVKGNTTLPKLMANLLDNSKMSYNVVNNNLIILLPKQPQTLTGIVTDAKTSEPIPGVSILVEGTTKGTITDLNGNYNIEIPEGKNILVFSYMGYETQKVTVDGQTRMDVKLVPAVSNLNEVVVIGYGTIRKKDLTGSVSVINSKALANGKSLSVGEAIQGLASGVNVRQNGDIGSEPNIKIRGIANFGNQNPLYVIDGLITTGGIRDLNVNDIESVQILKDASAAAIYGNRAANGVIIITTKKGQSGATKIDFSSKIGIEKLPSLNLMDTTDFFFFNDMAYTNAGLSPQNHFKNSTNWEKETLRTGFLSEYNLGVSGGTSQGNYLVSGNYYTNNGTFIGTDFKRYSLRVNTEAKKGIFTFGENLAITDTEVVPYSGGNPITDVMRMTPDISVYDSLNPGGFGYGDEGRARTFGTNPLAIQNLVKLHSENIRIRGNVYGEAQIFKFLKFRTSLGYETSSDAFKRLRKIGNFTLNLPYEPSHVYENKAKYHSLLFDNFLTFEHSFGKHNVHAVLGSSFNREGYEQIWGLNNDIFVSGGEYLDVLNAGSSSPSVGGFRAEIMRISYFGRINYDFDGKYLLSATLRRDATSQFSREYRTGYFPSISAGWRISREKFFNISWINDLKIRGSYGELGNSAFQNWGANSGILDYIPRLSTFGLAIFGTGQFETLYTGAIQRELINPDLRWETKKQMNLGTDLALLKNRLQVSADYFVSTTQDVLVEFPIALATGNDGGNPWVNAGTLQNRGVEMELIWKESKGNFSYSVSANFTKLNNEVLDLPYGDPTIITNLCKTTVGQPLAMFYLIKTDGIFQSEEEVLQHVNSSGVVIQPNAKPGDIRYVDFDDNGLISAAGDRQIVGSPWPKFEAGFGIETTYKNLDFSMHGFGAFGQKIWNGTRALVERFSDNSNYRNGIDPWAPENTDTDFPRILYGDERNVLGNTDRWLEDGSFFRIQLLSLGYNFKIDRIKKYVDLLRLSLTAQNLVNFTKYRGLDPEFNNGNVLEFGSDYNSYPTPRSFLVSVSARF